MIVKREDLGNEYRKIRAACGGSSPVMVFVTPECDSLCACHIFTGLLRTDHIPYKVKPVSSYEDLFEANDAIDKESDEISAIVLINCGGTVELARFFTVAENTQIFVFDSHRPYHLSNVDETNHTVVLLDGSMEEEEYPSDYEVSSSDESSESDFESNRSPRKRKSDSEDRHERQRVIAEYYHGSYYGISAATVCFSMAHQLQKNDSDVLWFGIVGLTDQFIHQRISRAKYQSEVDIYMSEVFKSQSSNDGDDPEQAADSAEDQIVIHGDGRLSFEREEFSFFLFRHWTLFEAMFHAREVATTLRVWREPGRRHLQMILAKLGIPLKESNSNYSFMESECKSRLRSQLPQYAKEYGLEDDQLFFPSFTRKYGSDLVISAGDMVHIVCGLLEHVSGDTEVNWNDNFWMAHDSIQSRDVALARKGLRLSIELQKEIVQIGHSLLGKKLVVSTGSYRLCILDNPGRTSSFRQPLALSKLAFFLIDAHEATLLATRKRQRNGRNRKIKVMPFVLCALIEERQSYIVIGIPREASQKDVLRNHFSTGFSEAAAQTKARVKHDGFESSVIEVQKDDLRQFLDILVTQLQR